jgi:hypothetical protein
MTWVGFGTSGDGSWYGGFRMMRLARLLALVLAAVAALPAAGAGGIVLCLDVARACCRAEAPPAAEPRCSCCATRDGAAGARESVAPAEHLHDCDCCLTVPAPSPAPGPVAAGLHGDDAGPSWLPTTALSPLRLAAPRAILRAPFPPRDASPPPEAPRALRV